MSNSELSASTDLLGFPPVLAACCGSRMFWFDRKDNRATFVDKRRERHTLPDVSSKGGSRELVIDPDHLADFTDLPFPDNTFALVVFDPPPPRLLTHCSAKQTSPGRPGLFEGGLFPDFLQKVNDQEN